MKTENLRVDWVDYAKGLGIILVVLGHAMSGAKDAGLLVNTGIFDPVYKFIYSFHMPLFFALSGLFFEKSLDKHHAKKFMINKLQTILYPFVVWSILQTGVEVLFSRQTNTGLSSDALYTCLFIPRSVYWFLFALFFINLINVVLYSVSRRYGLLISFAVWLIVFVLKPDFGSFDKTFYNLLYFNSGILLARNQAFFWSILENKLYVVFSIVLLLGAEYLYFSYDKSVWFNSLLTQIIGSIVVMQVSFYAVQTRTKALINFLGENSMVIFLTHVLFVAGFRIFLQKVLHIENVAVHILFNTLFGLFFPLVLKYISVQKPQFGWLFQYNKSANQPPPKKVAIQ